jgi:hypothetical protein
MDMIKSFKHKGTGESFLNLLTETPITLIMTTIIRRNNNENND